jgi:hypothetical protein
LGHFEARRPQVLNRLKELERLLPPLVGRFPLLLQGRAVNADRLGGRLDFVGGRWGRQGRCARRRRAKVWPLEGEFAFHRLGEVANQVKAIGHLYGLRCAAPGALRVEALAVAADDGHLGMVPQPLGQRIRRTRRQQVDDLAPLQID